MSDIFLCLDKSDVGYISIMTELDNVTTIDERLDGFISGLKIAADFKTINKIYAIDFRTGITYLANDGQYWQWQDISGDMEFAFMVDIILYQLKANYPTNYDNPVIQRIKKINDLRLLQFDIYQYVFDNTKYENATSSVRQYRNNDIHLEFVYSVVGLKSFILTIKDIDKQPAEYSVYLKSNFDIDTFKKIPKTYGNTNTKILNFIKNSLNIN